MMHHYPDLVSVSDWLKQISHMGRPLWSTTLIWVVTRDEFSALGPQTSFCVEIIKWCCKMAAVFLLLLLFFFQATKYPGNDTVQLPCGTTITITLVMIQSNSHVGSPPTYRKHQSSLGQSLTVETSGK